MPEKTIQKLKTLGKVRRQSLSTKVFFMILQFSLILSFFAVTFGFYLYSTAVLNRYASIAYNMSKTAAVLYEEEHMGGYLNRLLTTYSSMSEADKADPTDKEYLKKYNYIQTDQFEEIRYAFYKVEQRNNVKSVYIAIIDHENNRAIYLIDSDHSKTYCPPGYWEPLEDKEIALFDEAVESDDEPPRMMVNSDETGFILISWHKIKDMGRYSIVSMTDVDMNHVIQASLRFLVQYVLLLAVVTIILDIIISRITKKTLVKPIVDMNLAARAYVADKGNGLSNEQHFRNLDIKTGDEIESLAVMIGNMEKEIGEYVDDLTKATGEKERMNAELGIASQIQDGMLPSHFPAFPDRTEFDIYASMQTAREVGGDFYDFFFIDDDHLALVMADVSGKGIPASLFMMASKILIDNIASLGNQDPAEILEIVNNQINKSNPAEMFLTVWLGILEVSTGRLKAANAGHEYPVLLTNQESFEVLKDKHGLVIGGMPGVKYKNYDLQLKPNDVIFVYTDGIPEAMNEKDELFGLDRLVEALNKDINASTEQLLLNVKASIKDFVQDTEQFDDITMMAFRYLGDENMNELTLEATVENIDKVTQFVDEKLELYNCPFKAQAQIDIAIDELFSNIANYAYQPDTGPATVKVEVEEEPLAVVITFIDHGKPYDPLQNEDPDTTLNAEERDVGGLGIFLVKKTMDEITYEYKDGKNILRIKKHI